MISDAVQKLFPDRGGYAARVDVAAPKGSPDMKTIKINAVDYDYIEKEAARIKKRFAEVFH
jgi:hypothetical protein